MPDVETSSIQIYITAEDNASNAIDTLKKKLESFAQVLDRVKAAWDEFSSDSGAAQAMESVANSVAQISTADFSNLNLTDATRSAGAMSTAMAQATEGMQTFEATAENAMQIFNQSQELTAMREMQTAAEEAGKPLTLVESVTDEIAENAENITRNFSEEAKAQQSVAEKVERTGEAVKETVQTVEQKTSKIRDLFDGVGDGIKNAFSGINDARVSQMSADWDKLTTSIGKALTPLSILRTTLNATANVWQIRFSLVKGIVNATVTAMKKLAQATLTVMKATAKASVYIGKAFGRVALAPINAMAKAIGNVASKLKTMFAGLVRIATYRLFRSMIKMITKGLNEGITALYQWSKALDQSFSKAMDLYATDRQFLNNSIAASLEPFIESIIPLLDQAVDKMVDLLNKFNQFASALAGKSVWTKALKVPAEYQEKAESAKKATDDLKRSLLGFDEINRLDDPDKGSKKKGKTVPDYSSMFKELPLTGTFAKLAKQIRKLIEEGEWYSAGKVLAEKLNSILKDWNPEKAGKILAKKINEIVDLARGFVETANWQSIGDKVAGTINNFLYNLKAKNIGKLIADTFNAAFKFALGFMKKIDGKAIGKTLSNIFNGFFETIDASTIGDTIFTTLNKALDIGISYFENLNKDAFYNSILNLLGRLKFADLGKKFSEFLNEGIGVIDADKIGQILTTALAGIADFVKNSVGNLNIGEMVSKITGTIEYMLSDTATIQKVAKGFETLLKGAIEAVGTFISTFPVNDLFEAITTFFNGIKWDEIGAGIGSSLRKAIDDIKPETIGTAISTVVTKAIDLLSAFNEKMDMTGWQKLGYDIGAAIANALNSIEWDKAGQTLSDLGVGITTAVKTAIETMDANGELSKAIDDLMNNIDWDTIATNLMIIIADAESVIGRALRELGKAVGRILWEGIKDFFLSFDFFEKLSNILSPAGKAYDAAKSAAKGTLPQQTTPSTTAPAAQAQSKVDTTTSATATTSNVDITEAVAAGVAEGTRRAEESGTGSSNVTVNVDGDNLFNFVVKKHNSTVKQTGKTPLYGV